MPSGYTYWMAFWKISVGSVKKSAEASRNHDLVQADCEGEMKFVLILLANTMSFEVIQQSLPGSFSMNNLTHSITLLLLFLTHIPSPLFVISQSILPHRAPLH